MLVSFVYFILVTFFVCSLVSCVCSLVVCARDWAGDIAHSCVLKCNSFMHFCPHIVHFFIWFDFYFLLLCVFRSDQRERERERKRKRKRERSIRNTGHVALGGRDKQRKEKQKQDKKKKKQDKKKTRKTGTCLTWACLSWAWCTTLCVSSTGMCGRDLCHIIIHMSHIIILVHHLVRVFHRNVRQRSFFL